LGLGEYETYLTEDSKDCESGTWVGGGTWEAKWDKAKQK
jgi:hypothetical protein